MNLPPSRSRKSAITRADLVRYAGTLVDELSDSYQASTRAARQQRMRAQLVGIRIPTDDELQAYLEENAEAYATGERLSIEDLYAPFPEDDEEGGGHPEPVQALVRHHVARADAERLTGRLEEFGPGPGSGRGGGGSGGRY